MILEELRSLMATQPFKPFSIYTGDGREVVVPHHDYAWVLPAGTVIHVQQFDGGADLIFINQITRLNYEAEAPARRTRRRGGK